MRFLSDGRVLAVAVCIVVLGLFSVPHTAVAADGVLDAGIVKVCDKTNQEGLNSFTGACQLCDLVQLADSMVRFAVAFAFIAATLMFAYAGVLYFTAASKPDNITKAHGVFIKVFVGLILILIAWLIVDIILKTLASNEISGPWKTIECIAYPTSDPLGTGPQHADRELGAEVTGSGQTGGGGGLPYNAAEETRVRALFAHHVGINHDPCTAPAASGCTNVGGLTEGAIQGILRLQRECGCTVTITGGTEQGPHATHTGRQVDISTSNQIGAWLTSNNHGTGLGITKICTTNASREYRYECGNYAETEEHLHLQF